MRKPFTLAVDLGGSHVAIALATDHGVRDIENRSVDPAKGLAPCLPVIKEAATLLLERNPDAVGNCDGIAMAVPMLVDSKVGRVTSTPRDKFEDAPSIDLNAWANTRLGLPFKLEVDAHAGCFGEWLYGAGKGCDDMVYVTLGTGYGSSVILRGRPLRGRTSQAGILGGHISVNAGGHQCVCPSRGCIEAETGTWALGGIAREDPRFSTSCLAAHDSINYRILFEESDAGDPLAHDLLERSLSYWAASFVNQTHAYNPERIVLAGGIMKAADRILPYMNEFIRKHVWTASDYPEVVVARHFETAALLGCRGMFRAGINYL